MGTYLMKSEKVSYRCLVDSAALLNLSLLGADEAPSKFLKKSTSLLSLLYEALFSEVEILLATCLRVFL